MLGSESRKHRVQGLNVDSHQRFPRWLSAWLRADLNGSQIHILILLLDLHIACLHFDFTRTFGHYNVVIVLNGLLIGARIALLARSAGRPAKLSYSEGLLLAY
jgi:hypothetical protein